MACVAKRPQILKECSDTFRFRDGRRSNKLIIHKASLIAESGILERGIDAHGNRFRQSRQNHSAARIYTRIKCKNVVSIGPF
jgi:hypothetical protein